MSRVKPKARLYATGRKPPPKRRLPGLGRIGMMLAVMLIAGGSATFAWRVGWPQQQVMRLADAAFQTTARAGLALHDVVVEGREFTGADELMAALQVRRGMPILAFDRASALQRLEQLPWLSGVVIERRLPDMLYVRLQERQPMARWQIRNRVHVIDRDGKAILPASAQNFTDLPLVVGEGAADHALDLVIALAAHPKIHDILRAATRIGNRRWDLTLTPGVTVRLPEAPPAEGLKRLATLMEEQQILARDITAIDLRIIGRTAIERASGNGANTKTAGGGAPKI